MAGRDEQQAAESPGPRVPDLIEQYRVRRIAWMAQADELARMRDEVRGSAEREAMEIVTAARRDVRRVVMGARRELLVLSAQVQATLGEEPSPPAPTQLPAGNTDQAHATGHTSLATFPEQGWGVAPNASVRSVLEEARAHMTALAEEARTVPFVEPPRGAANAPAPAPAPVPAPSPAPPLSPAASSVVLSPPFQRQRVEVWPGTRVGTVVALFVVAAFAVLLGTVWVLNRSSNPEPEPARVDASAGESSAPRVPATAASVAPPVRGPDTPATDEPGSVSVLIEARRPAWIRTIVDGRADAGRTLEAGVKYEVRGARSVSLRVGDAGAVMVSVNGGEPRPLGGDGQVVSRLYTVEQPVPSTGKQEQPSSTPAVPEAEQPRLAPAPSKGPVQPAAAAPAPAAPLATVLPAPQALAAAFAAATFPRTAGPQDAAPVSREVAPFSLIPRAEGTSLREPSQESALVTAAQQWLDAYHRQDRASLAALSMETLVVADERSPQERFPSGIGSVSRTLDRVKIDVAADTAVLTGIMTERAEAGGLERVSPVSQLWVLRGGAWRLWQARLVSEARLNQFSR